MGAVRLARRPPKPAPRHALEGEPRRDRTAIVLVVLLILTSGFVAGTTATFNASTRNPNNSFATAALDAPTSLTADARGNNVDLSWTTVSGANNAGAGYNTNWKDLGAPTSTGGVPGVGCTSGGYTNISAATDPNSATYEDTAVTTRANYAAGRYYCYEVQTRYPCCTVPEPTAWVSQGANPVKEVQVGFVVAKVTFANGAGSSIGTMSTADTITVSLNQRIFGQAGTGEPPVTGTVCTENATALGLQGIWIGQSPTSGGCDPSSETTTGLHIFRTSAPNREVRFQATYAWANCTNALALTVGCKEIVVTLGSRVAGSQNPSSMTGTWNARPQANTFVSAVGSLPVCTTNPAGGLCQVQATGTL